MAVQGREILTNTAIRFRTHGEYFRVRKARSLAPFLTTTSIVEMKPKRNNLKKKKHDQKEKRREREEKKKEQKKLRRSNIQKLI